MTNAEILARGYWARHVEQVNQFFEDGLLDFDSLPERERNDIVSRCAAGLEALTAAGLCIMPVEPTETQVVEGGLAIERSMFEDCDPLVFDGSRKCYRAMVASRPQEPRPMTGILPTMTPEQQEAAKAYTGSINMGDPSMLKAVTIERRRCAKIANDKADELYAVASRLPDYDAASYSDAAFIARSIANAISIGEGK